jgi:hypothetical protein
MSRQSTICLGIMLATALATTAHSAPKDLTVQLKFTPQEGVHSESPDLPPAMLDRAFELRIEDGRGGEAAVIGQGTDDDDRRFPITAQSDVVSYMRETLQSVASDWGLKAGDPKQRVLTLKVMRFFVEESNKAVGSVYASEVKFTYVLSDGAGKRLAEGAGSGSAHRYGRARSADNCSEVLSDAMKEAFGDVLSSASLQSAWSSGKAAGVTNDSAPASDTVEERLRRLEDLLKKGLITKDEYDKKRAEILKDV